MAKDVKVLDKAVIKTVVTVCVDEDKVNEIVMACVGYVRYLLSTQSRLLGLDSSVIFDAIEGELVQEFSEKIKEVYDSN